MTGAAASGFLFDPFSPEVVADPDTWFRKLRDDHPVYYNDEYDTFYLSRFDDVWSLLSLGDNALLATETNLPTAEYLRTHHNDGAPPFASTEPMAPGPTLPSPYFEQMRRAHIAPLLPRSVAALEGFVRDHARTQLDRLLPRGRFNLTTDYAAIIPARVVCHLFGLPLSIADEVMGEIRKIGTYRPGKRGIDLLTFFTELQKYIIPAIRARRAAGADGSVSLIDGLIHHRTQPEGRALGDQEIADQLVCAMVGGMESVPKVTGRGVMELCRRPDQLAAVRADLAGNVPVAVEEMIRYCAPAQYTYRTAHKDVKIAGQRVCAGQRVACMLYSASRDEREFDDPDEFVWNRRIPRVLSFGLGQHHCIGKHLARLEVSTMVHELLSRTSSIEFVMEEAERNVGYFQRGLTSLPVLVKP